MRTPQWYTEAELQAFDVRILSVVDDLHWLMDLLAAYGS